MQDMLFQVIGSLLTMIAMGVCFAFCSPWFQFGEVVPPQMPCTSDVEKAFRNSNATEYQREKIWKLIGKKEDEIKHLEPGLQEKPIVRFVWVPMIFVFYKTVASGFDGIVLYGYMIGLVLVLFISFFATKHFANLDYSEGRMLYSCRKTPVPWKSDTVTIKEIEEYIEFPEFYCEIYTREAAIAKREQYYNFFSTIMVALFAVVTLAYL